MPCSEGSTVLVHRCASPRRLLARDATVPTNVVINPAASASESARVPVSELQVVNSSAWSTAAFSMGASRASGNPAARLSARPVNCGST